MTFGQDHKPPWCLVFLASFLFSGCYQEPEVVQAVVVEIPKQFTAGGTSWKLKQMGPKEEATLSQFFMKHQELMESPEFEGYPSVFASEDNTHRFYWLHPSVDGPEWRCVEAKGRKSNILEGTGNPFE